MKNASSEKSKINVLMLADVHTKTYGTLMAGSLMSLELVDRGTNWIRVVLPSGDRKTLFNFDAKIV